MNREYLKNLGLEKDTINAIMKMHGLAMQEARKAQDGAGSNEEMDLLEQQLTDLQEKLGGQTLEEIALDNERLKQKIEEYELNDLKLKIAMEHKLPIGIAKYLVGSTERELHDDAKRVSAYTKRPPMGYTPATGKDAGLKNMLRKLSH